MNIYEGKEGFKDESVKPNPETIYGMQKLEIERYLEKEFEEYLILRSPKVIGEKKKDNTLLTNWVEDLQKGNEIVCADDQFFCATHIDNIVEMYYRVKEKGLKGIYNVCAKTTYTRLEMAEILAEKMRIKPKIKKVKNLRVRISR